MEIVRPIGYDKAQARALFASTEALGIEVVAEREASRRTEPSVTLHVRKSKLFMRMTRAAVEKLFADGCPSPETAHAFALAWLDGDGTVTLSGTRVLLRLAGLESEHAAVERALQQAFGWERVGAAFDHTASMTTISLRASDILRLLDADAFSFSLNRVRLLLGLGQRTERLSQHRPGAPLPGAFSRWGLVEDGMLTDAGIELLKGAARWRDHIAQARALWHTAPYLFGVKGVGLPLAFRGQNKNPRHDES